MFNTLFYEPVYNFVVWLLNYIPDAGIVIIITTLVVKFILFPLHKKQIKTQIATKKAKPELDALKEKYGKDMTPEIRQKMAMETMAVYRKYEIKPFASILVLLIQIPVLISLYWIFYRGGLPEIDLEHLYSFIEVPKQVSMYFLNWINLAEPNFVLAVIAGLAQYAHSSISMKDTNMGEMFGKAGDTRGKSFKDDLKKDLGKSFQASLKYGMPIFIFFLLTTVLNAAVAIYWIVSNVFQVIQEILVRKEKKEIRQLAEKET